ncbi:MAG: L-histidine N(alpha)-methyltransferase [Cyanobacteria bacterium P01_G01_bin.54]
MNKNTEDEKVIGGLEQEALDFFSGKISGNLWPYLYGTPQDETDPVRGGILYNEMLENEEDYYLYKYEAKLFQSQGKQLTSLIGSQATFIELGPGSEQSLRLKTVPLLKTCSDLEGYVGIDISQSFLDKGLAVIRSEFPDISMSGIQHDFMKLESLPAFQKTVVLFKGSTIANLRRDEVPVFITKIKGLIPQAHYLLLVHDANQDETSLMEAYDNPGMAVFMENIMQRVKRDLDLLEFDASAFQYKPEWEPNSHDLKHVLSATKAQKFKIGGQVIEIEKGQKFHTLSSFKYPVKKFQEFLGSTGYEPIDFCVDASGRMAAHLFKG